VANKRREGGAVTCAATPLRGQKEGWAAPPPYLWEEQAVRLKVAPPEYFVAPLGYSSPKVGPPSVARGTVTGDGGNAGPLGRRTVGDAGRKVG